MGPDPAGLTEIEQVFKSIISVVAGLGFMTTLVVLVLAGFKYLTSGGEPKAVQAAHQTVVWALLGILLMAIAWLILLLVKNFTGIEVTVLDIRSLCTLTPGGTDFCSPSPRPSPGP